MREVPIPPQTGGGSRGGAHPGPYPVPEESHSAPLLTVTWHIEGVRGAEQADEERTGGKRGAPGSEAGGPHKGKRPRGEGAGDADDSPDRHDPEPVGDDPQATLQVLQSADYRRAQWWNSKSLAVRFIGTLLDLLPEQTATLPVAKVLLLTASGAKLVGPDKWRHYDNIYTLLHGWAELGHQERVYLVQCGAIPRIIQTVMAGTSPADPALLVTPRQGKEAWCPARDSREAKGFSSVTRPCPPGSSPFLMAMRLLYSLVRSCCIAPPHMHREHLELESLVPDGEDRAITPGLEYPRKLLQDVQPVTMSAESWKDATQIFLPPAELQLLLSKDVVNRLVYVSSDGSGTRDFTAHTQHVFLVLRLYQHLCWGQQDHMQALLDLLQARLLLDSHPYWSVTANVALALVDTERLAPGGPSSAEGLVLWLLKLLNALYLNEKRLYEANRLLEKLMILLTGGNQYVGPETPELYRQVMVDRLGQWLPPLLWTPIVGSTPRSDLCTTLKLLLPDPLTEAGKAAEGFKNQPKQPWMMYSFRLPGTGEQAAVDPPVWGGAVSMPSDFFDASLRQESEARVAEDARQNHQGQTQDEVAAETQAVAAALEAEDRLQGGDENMCEVIKVVPGDGPAQLQPGEKRKAQEGRTTRAPAKQPRQQDDPRPPSAQSFSIFWQLMEYLGPWHKKNMYNLRANESPTSNGKRHYSFWEFPHVLTFMLRGHLSESDVLRDYTPRFLQILETVNGCHLDDDKVKGELTLFLCKAYRLHPTVVEPYLLNSCPVLFDYHCSAKPFGKGHLWHEKYTLPFIRLLHTLYKRAIAQQHVQFCRRLIAPGSSIWRHLSGLVLDSEKNGLVAAELRELLKLLLSTPGLGPHAQITLLDTVVGPPGHQMKGPKTAWPLESTVDLLDMALRYPESPVLWDRFVNTLNGLDKMTITANFLRKELHHHRDSKLALPYHDGLRTMFDRFLNNLMGGLFWTTSQPTVGPASSAAPEGAGEQSGRVSRLANRWENDCARVGTGFLAQRRDQTLRNLLETSGSGEDQKQALGYLHYQETLLLKIITEDVRCAAGYVEQEAKRPMWPPNTKLHGKGDEMGVRELSRRALTWHVNVLRAIVAHRPPPQPPASPSASDEDFETIPAGPLMHHVVSIMQLALHWDMFQEYVDVCAACVDLWGTHVYMEWKDQVDCAYYLFQNLVLCSMGPGITRGVPTPEPVRKLAGYFRTTALQHAASHENDQALAWAQQLTTGFEQAVEQLRGQLCQLGRGGGGSGARAEEQTEEASKAGRTPPTAAPSPNHKRQRTEDVGAQPVPLQEPGVAHMEVAPQPSQSDLGDEPHEPKALAPQPIQSDLGGEPHDPAATPAEPTPAPDAPTPTQPAVPMQPPAAPEADLTPQQENPVPAEPLQSPGAGSTEDTPPPHDAASQDPLAHPQGPGSADLDAGPSPAPPSPAESSRAAGSGGAGAENGGAKTTAIGSAGQQRAPMGTSAGELVSAGGGDAAAAGNGTGSVADLPAFHALQEVHFWLTMLNDNAVRMLMEREPLAALQELAAIHALPELTELCESLTEALPES